MCNCSLTYSELRISESMFFLEKQFITLRLDRRYLITKLSMTCQLSKQCCWSKWLKGEKRQRVLNEYEIWLKEPSRNTCMEQNSEVVGGVPTVKVKKWLYDPGGVEGSKEDRAVSSMKGKKRNERGDPLDREMGRGPRISGTPDKKSALGYRRIQRALYYVKRLLIFFFNSANEVFWMQQVQDEHQI